VLPSIGAGSLFPLHLHAFKIKLLSWWSFFLAFSNWRYQPILVVTAGGKDVAVIQNWKVDPRCPNAGNPFHICAQYCFDHLSEAPQPNATKSGAFFCSP
jgi:hypothetical protein